MTLTIRQAKEVLETLHKNTAFVVRLSGETKERKLAKVAEIARRGRNGGTDMVLLDIADGTRFDIFDQHNKVKGLTAPSEGENQVFKIVRSDTKQEVALMTRREVGKGELPAHISSLKLQGLPEVVKVKAWVSKEEKAAAAASPAPAPAPLAAEVPAVPVVEG
jgi:hypothetical protein